ncbi:hypothetical protein [Paenarthrobacter aurescens]|uniref:hypothetical protein n=1 Tax=Paenarthrobacter aurescens TaxID=43663 RepID=UPI0021C0A7B0|nr:hypothetical protein [Paenarthrobacter aurescens]MCT9868630.1 hypothetical protein [Paenarthrobacter aurescens]
MNSGARPSPGLMVTIVFCMTVLLGIGGTAAFALWEQSSHSAEQDKADASVPSAPAAP